MSLGRATQRLIDITSNELIFRLIWCALLLSVGLLYCFASIRADGLRVARDICRMKWTAICCDALPQYMPNPHFLFDNLPKQKKIESHWSSSSSSLSLLKLSDARPRRKAYKWMIIFNCFIIKKNESVCRSNSHTLHIRWKLLTESPHRNRYEHPIQMDANQVARLICT